jgi:hypothetical protein
MSGNFGQLRSSLKGLRMTEALFFNASAGYLEAIIRGYKGMEPLIIPVLRCFTWSFPAGLLTQTQFSNLCQSETIEDLKMSLSATYVIEPKDSSCRWLSVFHPQ